MRRKAVFSADDITLAMAFVAEQNPDKFKHPEMKSLILRAQAWRADGAIGVVRG